MLKETVYKKQKQWCIDDIERPDLEATTHTKLTFYPKQYKQKYPTERKDQTKISPQ